MDTEAIALGSMTPRGTRRLIHVSDPSNTTGLLSDPAAQPRELRQIVRNYAREGHIDTVVQEIFAEARTQFWRTDKTPVDLRYQHRRLIPMMDNGLMPIEVYIDECHKQGMEFIAGFRMNDRHGHHPAFFRKLSEENPEWILTEYPPSWGGAPPESHHLGSSLNYAVPGVRDYLFSIMEEVAHRFDIDGIEFNFTRLVECFPRAEAAQSHPLMTDFVRRVRAMLDEAGTMSISPMPLDRPGYPPPVDRDRRLLLGVRVPQQLAGCAAWGLNVPTWIEEGLVDYVAPADFGFTDFNESYEDFTRLARGHDCYVYPQVQTKLGIDADIDMEPARYRAAVRNFYAAGADGLSTQNYFFHWLPQFESPGEDGPAIPEEYPRGFNYLKELRDPDEIATGDRHYVFLLLWADLNDGHGMSHIYQPQRIVLERGPAEARGNYRFRVCEHFPADPILPLTTEGSGLSFFPKGLAKGDRLAIDINGTAVPSERVSWTWNEEGPPSCKVALSSPPFRYGNNVLGLTLEQGAAGAEGDIVVERLECMVRVTEVG